MDEDWTGKTVLITGGTRGIGLAVGLAFGARGAQVALTHRWGSADEAAIEQSFVEAGASPPLIFEADAASDEDLENLLEKLKATMDGIDLFVSNVAVVQRGDGRFGARTLRQSMQWTTWPLERYFEKISTVFGKPPRRVLAMSSDGHEHFYPGYDYAAASKAALESLCRQLARAHPASQFNVLRSRQVQTTSLEEMFGDARELMSQFSDFDITAEEVADAAVAVSSGLLDACSGEVLVLDHGATFQDNLVALGPALLSGERVNRQQSDRQGVGEVHWVDVGVAAPSDAVWPDVAWVSADAQADAVIVAIDWSTADESSATLLATTVEAMVERGHRPRYAIQIDIAGANSPCCAASRSVGRYFDAWRISEDLRVNFVAIDSVAEAHQAVFAARALTSGKLDAVRGQLLNLKARP